jgi:DNA-binding transcriptional LysR family regulator
MLDGVTLDQLRTFIAAAEQGSFSAAGRKLRRAQSVVSHTLANLEGQLGVALFERSGRYPQLTEEGQFLLRDARAVADHMDDFKARARSMREGLEPELSAVMDVMYPMPAITHAMGQCQHLFPKTPLRLYVEALGGVVQPVLDGSCRIGVIGSLPTVPEELTAEPLALVPFATVVSPQHALATSKKPLSSAELSKHVQLVLTDRTSLTSGRSFGVISPLVWRLADLGAKHAFLRAGFGWGHMPVHMVQDDLHKGQLIEIRTHANAKTRASLEMQAVYRKDAPPGPIGRAFIEALRH